MMRYIWLLWFMMPLMGAVSGPTAPRPVAAGFAEVTSPAVQTTSASQDSTVGEKTNQKVQQIKKLFSGSILLLILVVIILTYFIVRLLARIIDNLSERASKYRLTIKRLVPVVRILLWIIAIYIIIAGIINPPFKTVLAVAASVGIAVGLASQDIVKNIFGGIMIILDKPFQVGDKIKVSDYYGEVKQIGLRSTRIVTPDDSEVSVPNGDAISKSVSNMNSGNLYGQVVAEVYLPANVDVSHARHIAYRAALSSRYLYLKKPIVVIALNEVHEENFVLKLRVKAYVLDIRYEFPFQSDMTEQILQQYNRDGIIPPPEGSMRQ